MNRESVWFQRMMKKYGSEEAISEVMARNASKNKRQREGDWGFAKLKEENPGKLKEISSDAAKKRFGKDT